MLEFETFAPLQSQTFELESAEALRLPVELVECSRLRNPGLDSRYGFSLIFESAVEPRWPQGIYRLHHPALVPEVLLVVPIGPSPDSRRMRYQVIFN